MNAPPESPDYLEIRLSYATVAFRIALGLAFVVGGISMWRGSNPIIGATTAISFGIGAVFGCRFFWDDSPGLVLGPEGIVINRKIGLGGSVPWTDITDLALLRYGHDWLLLIKVGHPDRYVGSQNVFYRFFNSISRSVFNTPVRVNTGLLDCDRNDVLTRVREMWAKYGNHSREG